MRVAGEIVKVRTGTSWRNYRDIPYLLVLDEHPLVPYLLVRLPHGKTVQNLPKEHVVA
jgi:hypothetical protein